MQVIPIFVSNERNPSEDPLSEALKPYAGDPAGQLLNSHAVVRVVGVAVEEPVPDLLSAGAERTTCAE
jgi:hypothetical protein